MAREGSRLGLERERGAMFPDIQALVTYYRSGARQQRVIMYMTLFTGDMIFPILRGSD